MFKPLCTVLPKQLGGRYSTPLLALASSLVVSAALASAAEAKKASSDNEKFTVVRESRPLVAREGVWQTYTDHIHVKPAQVKKQWQLTFTNGAEGRPKVTDLKVTLGGKPFATIQDFDANGNLSRSLNELVTPGTNVLTSQVIGPSGSRLAWKILSEKPTITSVQPNPYSRDENLTIQGTKFSDDQQCVKATIAGKNAELVSVNSTCIVIKPPAGIPSGEQKLIVAVDTAKSNALKVSARPNIYWINDTSTSPTQPLTIIGRGFSKVASENVVTISTYTARVISATDHSITIIVPEMPFPNHGLPIKVTSNGVSSTDHLVLDVDIRVIPNMVDAPKIIH